MAGARKRSPRPSRKARCAILTVGLGERAAGLVAHHGLRRAAICEHVQTGQEALHYLRTHRRSPPHLIFCAEELPDGSWLHVRQRTRRRLVLVSRLADEKLWAEVLNRGASDLLRDPFTELELNWIMDAAWPASESGVSPSGPRAKTMTAAG